MELRWSRFCFEILILVVCYGTYSIIFYENVLPTTYRGFFCNDESLMHSYDLDTITWKATLISSYSITLVLIIVTECILGRRDQGRSHFLCCPAPPLICKLYNYIVGFLLSMGFSIVTMEVSKRLAGRLRPYFLTFCMPDIGTAVCPENTYITNYTCTSPLYRDNWRQSFFSGHTTMSFCGSVFAILYIYERWPRQGIWNFLSAFVSFLLVLQSSCIAITRITDNAHFPSDVITGILVGSLISFLTARYVCEIGIAEKTSDSRGSKGSEELDEKSQIIQRMEPNYSGNST